MRYSGKPVSPGMACGVAVPLAGTISRLVPRYAVTDEQVAAENERLDAALRDAGSELEALRGKVLGEIGRAESQIVESHIAMLNDPGLIARIKRRVGEELINVEQALDMEIMGLVKVLAAAEDAYLRERTQDLRDVGDRILHYLENGTARRRLQLPDGAVVIASELFPTDTIALDRSKVVAIVTEHGGLNGHAAILARAYGIPAVTGIADVIRAVPARTAILVDGTRGEVIVDPTPGERTLFDASRQAVVPAPVTVIEPRQVAGGSLASGEEIALRANVGLVDQVAEVTSCGLGGIGLFRTEFLYVDRSDPPTAAEQEEYYSAAVEAVDGRPVVFRLFDFGGDKWPLFLPPHHEENPTLGLRGLRCLFAHPGILRDQVGALVRASTAGDARILVPMVIDPTDFRQVLGLVRDVAQELGIPVPPVGAMIETPAAVYHAATLAGLADFLSIGSNDLAQFVLAADRNAEEMVGAYSTMHPAVLGSIRRAIDVAGAVGTPIGICGEAAGDPAMACVLVGLGLTSLSMSPARSRRVRQVLRTIDLATARSLADRALAAEGAAEVHDLIRRELPGLV